MGALHESLPDPPESSAPGAADRTALRLAARREHELLALCELSQELTVALDVFGAADLVLFNLMGQAGTSRAALWLLADEDHRLVLVRSHGFARAAAAAIGDMVPQDVLARLCAERRILVHGSLEAELGSTLPLLMRRESVMLLAPVLSRDAPRGLIALGPRVDRQSYGPVEIQVLQAALGMVGVALENVSLYNRLLENNRQLRHANEHLRELDTLKSEFLRNVNHELRTPLTVIIAYLQCMSDPRFRDEDSKEFLSVCLRESIRLKGLIETLLDFSDVSRNQTRLRERVDDVSTTLHKLWEQRLPGITEELRELILEVEPDVPKARFDPQRLEQVLDELVDNAVKFTPRGAHIRLRAFRLELDEAMWAAIEVTDDGPGITPERLPLLFQAFRQSDGSSTRPAGGMGLGLAFARELTEKMGGLLEAESAGGRGSCFRVRFRAEA